MDIQVIISALGTQLTTLVAKGTTARITDLIKSNKETKDSEKLRVFYDGIINDLLNEREEAVMIAQTYKDELSKVIISDADIQHLSNTISKVLEVLKKSSPGLETEKLEPIKELINIDVLKTMQLLGFNYKAAIGEPLTEICSNAIKDLIGKSKSNNKIKKN